MVRNYRLLGEALRNNFNDAFGLDSISVVPNGDKSALSNEKYKFMFIHVFEGFRYVSHSGWNKVTPESLKYHFHLIGDKYRYLTQNSREAFANSKKALYVIYADISRGHNTQNDFLNLLSAIKTKRDNNFLLLVLVANESSVKSSFDMDIVLDGNLIQHAVSHYVFGQWDWPESIKQWDDVLHTIIT